MSDSMIERVKGVLFDHGLDAVSEPTLTAAARAAIEAMREPTEAMLQAAHPGLRNLSWPINSDPDRENVEVWHYMIAAALNEKPE